MVLEVKITGGVMLVDSDIWLRFCIEIGHTLHITNHGYAAYREKTIKLFHRWLFDFPTCYVGHLDANKLNNQIKNLYLCDQPTNSKNLNDHLQRNNTTGIRGVIFSKREQKFKAEIKVNQKRFYLGTFDTLSEAAFARKQAEARHGFYK